MTFRLLRLHWCSRLVRMIFKRYFEPIHAEALVEIKTIIRAGLVVQLVASGIILANALHFGTPEVH